MKGREKDPSCLSTCCENNNTTAEEGQKNKEDRGTEKTERRGLAFRLSLPRHLSSQSFIS